MKPTVLVIEDNELNRDLLNQLLEDDYEVVEREDGQAGLEAAIELNPDLIILDLALPIVDGWEVARRIRADDPVSRVPIVALTAHAMPGDRAKALAAGCDEYLTKPIDEKVLFATLHRLLGQ